jgi:hypothetical protein
VDKNGCVLEVIRDNNQVFILVGTYFGTLSAYRLLQTPNQETELKLVNEWTLNGCITSVLAFGYMNKIMQEQSMNSKRNLEIK